MYVILADLPLGPITVHTSLLILIQKTHLWNIWSNRRTVAPPQPPTKWFRASQICQERPLFDVSGGPGFDEIKVVWVVWFCASWVLSLFFEDFGSFFRWIWLLTCSEFELFSFWVLNLLNLRVWVLNSFVALNLETCRIFRWNHFFWEKSRRPQFERKNHWLVRGFVGDENYPGKILIIVNHWKDPYWTTRIQMESKAVFFVAQFFIVFVYSKKKSQREGAGRREFIANLSRDLCPKAPKTPKTPWDSSEFKVNYPVPFPFGMSFFWKAFAVSLSKYQFNSMMITVPSEKWTWLFKKKQGWSKM